MLHRTSHMFVRQSTALINAVRAHLAELGIVAAVGRTGVDALLKMVADPKDGRVPEVARECLTALGHQPQMVKARILDFDRRILAWHRTNETTRHLDAILGLKPALAAALVASLSDPKAFRSACDSAAWIGLVPKQNSSRDKERLGGVTKQGDLYLRSLITAGAVKAGEARPGYRRPRRPTRLRSGRRSGR